jgi:hypothetical protein
LEEFTALSPMSISLFETLLLLAYLLIDVLVLVFIKSRRVLLMNLGILQIVLEAFQFKLMQG